MFTCNTFFLERLKNQVDSLQNMFKNHTKFNFKGGGEGRRGEKN